MRRGLKEPLERMAPEEAETAASSPMRRGLKDGVRRGQRLGHRDSSIFPDEEGTERLASDHVRVLPTITAASSPMRRGLKGAQASAGWPINLDSSIFPDEEGTESRRRGLAKSPGL